MDPHYSEWLHLCVRWLHIIAGVAWIGSSFYFNWLEGNLDRRQKPSSGLAGSLWAVHGGGFYHIVKYTLAPSTLPETLHWFKWEAYTTWLSGFALLAVVYYMGAKSYLLDPAVADLTPTQGIVISISCLLCGWFAYDGLCRSPLGKKPIVFAGVSFTLALGLAYSLCQVFSSRGAYIHMGAVLGTIMAANVFFVIIPSQKAMVNAIAAGQQPDGALGKKALQRSLHNNYMTLPVLFIMISNHFPFTYGHAYNWLILGALSLIGALVRHYFNLKNWGHRKVWILPLAALAMIALALITKAPVPPQQAHAGGHVTFRQVQEIINRRCTSCHSSHPTDEVFTIAPNGVKFDSPMQIGSRVAVIKLRVVDSQTMPLANKTGMTADERQLMATWIAEGATLEL